MEGLDNISKVEKKEKPDVLYVSAQTPNIHELVPIEGNYRDINEGSVIFSTPDKGLASAFLVEGHGDHWMQIGFYGDVPVVVINADRNEFIKNDKGGVMYTVPSDTFDYDPNKGMGDKEWTSHEPVRPISETRYISALDAMIGNGIQVYFVDKKTFDDINNSDNYGYDILVNMKSENEERDENIKSLKI
jgi:hypothetical protein